MYVLLILEPKGQRQSRSEAQGRDLYDQMLRFGEDLQRQGLSTMAQSLKTDTIGVRVAARGDQMSVVDGPFAESKEMIGGFFLLTCPTLAQAVEIAKACPAARWATVEVRELGPCFM